jgi:hypothetical protein
MYEDQVIILSFAEGAPASAPIVRHRAQAAGDLINNNGIVCQLLYSQALSWGSRPILTAVVLIRHRSDIHHASSSSMRLNSTEDAHQLAVSVSVVHGGRDENEMRVR